MEQVTKKKWKDIELKVRILFVLQIVVSLALIVLASLQLTGKWEGAINVFEPLLGVMMIINGLCASKLSVSKFNKIVAYFSYGVAIFIFMITAKIFFF